MLERESGGEELLESVLEREADSIGGEEVEFGGEEVAEVAEVEATGSVP